MNTRELPTKPGSVIGWSSYYDGSIYGSAMLERNPDNGEDHVWYRAGYNQVWSQEEMQERIGDNWILLGVIPPNRPLPSSAEKSEK